MIPFLSVMFLFLTAHAVADFCLQSEWMVTNKNRNHRKTLTAEQQKKFTVIWPYLLTSHALSHGLGVFLVTGSIAFGVAETAIHWIIDFGKGEKWYGFHTDQVLHIGSKVVWAYLFTRS